MIGTICTYAILFIFLAYFIPHLVVAWFYKTKNLKKSYNAEWALVTGASSGERACCYQGQRAFAAASRPPTRPLPTRLANRTASTLLPPCSCPQASASRSPRSWRGRG